VNLLLLLMPAKNSETKGAPLAVRTGEKRRVEEIVEKAAAGSEDKVIEARAREITYCYDARQNSELKK
jgi:hypothetical protein